VIFLCVVVNIIIIARLLFYLCLLLYDIPYNVFFVFYCLISLLKDFSIKSVCCFDSKPFENIYKVHMNII